MKDIKKLRNAKPTQRNAQLIFEWFDELEACITRGDMMIGLLDPALVEQVGPALKHAAKADPCAWVFLGQWMASPAIGPPDYKAADAAFLAAAKEDFVDAAENLVRIRYFHRREEVSKAQMKQAYQLLLAELEAAPRKARLLHLQGLLVTAGFGTQASPEEGYLLQQKAAKLGDLDALFEMYIHLATGLGVEKDEARAHKYCVKAANAGQPRATYNMGVFYATGRNVKVDMKKSAFWYRKACEMGNGQACSTLGAMCAQGQGMSVNRKKAAQYFAKAEECGFDPSFTKMWIDWEG